MSRHMIASPVVPFTSPLPQGFNNGARIEIHGEALKGPQNGFIVDFPTREGVAAHIAVRMGLNGERAIVANNVLMGSWGYEEKFQNNIVMGASFVMTITCTPTHFTIHVNSQVVANFNHRANCNTITALTVTGDVKISKIFFENFVHHQAAGVGYGAPPAYAPSAPVVAAAPPAVVYQQPPPVVVAQPQVVYAPPQPQVVVVEDHHHHGGPRVGGFLTGMVVGNMVGRNIGRRHHRH